jgi:hypothetical protein
VRILKCREVVTESELVEAITTYFAAYREWRGPPDMLFAKIGHPLDEDEAILFDLLIMAGDALAERGIVITISSGYIVLTRAEPDLVERIVAYMTGRVTVSAVPERLLTVMGQPLADEAVMIARLKKVEGALAECGVAMMFADGGQVVLEHCRPQRRLG